MPSDKARVSAIIKKRLQDRAKQVQGTVVVRDIIVVNTDNSGPGEFYGFSAYYNHELALRYEAEETLIKRMFRQIRQIAREVNFIHLDDNFEWVGDRLKMLPGKENHVTRLSFNEFYFYPYQKHGPLSQHGFDALVQKVDTLAHELPENLHLVLASFPVMDAKHQVHNMVLHVQCGEEAKLYSFAKAIPSKQDIDYKETTSPYLMAGHKVDGLIEQMVRLVDKIGGQLILSEGYSDSDSDSESDLDESEEEPVVDKERLERLKKILELCGVDQSSAIIASIKRLIFLSLQEPRHLESCEKEMAMIESELSAVVSKVRKKAAKGNISLKRIQEGSLYSAKLGASDQPFSGVNFGGFLPCATKGGVEFLTVIDICLDHHYQLAKTMVAHQVKQNIFSAPVFTPHLVSTMLSSASIEVDNTGVLGGSVVHADPRHPEIQVIEAGSANKQLTVESMSVFVNAHFGTTSKMFLYPAMALSSMSGVFGHTISRLNHFGEALKAELMLSHRYPTDAGITQAIEDIRLRIAIAMDDPYRVSQLMKENASLAYIDEHGESTLALVKKSHRVKSYLIGSRKIVNEFSELMLNGCHTQAIQLFDEAVRWNLAQHFESAFDCVADPMLRQRLLRSATQWGDYRLMGALLEKGADVLMGDPSTGLSFLSEMLVKEDKFHRGIEILKTHFRVNLFITTNQLIAALPGLADVDKALRFYFLVAIDRKDAKFLSRVVALGVDYLGKNPITDDFLLQALLDAKSEVMLSCVFDDAFKKGKFEALIDVILKCDTEDFDIITPIETIFSINHDQESAINDFIQGLIERNQYHLIMLMLRDKPFFDSLPSRARTLVVEAADNFDAFQSSIRSGDVADVAESLKRGMSPNLSFEDGGSPMFDAMVLRHLPMLKLLLDAGADLNVVDAEGYSPLRHAIHASNWPAIQLICEHAKKTPAYRSLVDHTIINKIRLRLFKDLSYFISSFGHAGDALIEMMDEALNVVRKLGIMVDLNAIFEEKTLMTRAVQFNNLAAARWLLDKGVSLDSVNENGMPLLGMAICSGNKSFFDFFISRNVSLEMPDKKNKSLICYAIERNKPEMVARLLELKKDLIDLNKKHASLRMNPLLYAIKKNYFAIADVFLSNGANINVAEEGTQRTALHIAVLKNNLGMVNFLLKRNADHTLQDASGLTPLGYARKFGCNDVILTLLTNARADALVDARPRSPYIR